MCASATYAGGIVDSALGGPSAEPARSRVARALLTVAIQGWAWRTQSSAILPAVANKPGLVGKTWPRAFSRLVPDQSS